MARWVELDVDSYTEDKNNITKPKDEGLRTYQYKITINQDGKHLKDVTRSYTLTSQLRPDLLTTGTPDEEQLEDIINHVASIVERVFACGELGPKEFVTLDLGTGKVSEVTIRVHV